MNSEKLEHVEVESVVESVRRGDDRALDKLFAAHHVYLRHVVGIRMDDALRIRVDPSDIVQDAHVEALRRVSDYVNDPKLPVRLWLRQIAIDRIGMAYRKHIGAEKRSVRREFTLPEQSSMGIAEQLVAGLSSPSMHVARHEVAAKVREAVAKLDDLDREIILLQAFEGLNSTESAQVLGIESATARKRFGRALLRLRSLLAESGLGESQP